MTKRKLYFGVILSVLVLSSCTKDKVSSNPSTWTFTGMGGGGAMFHPTISPHNQNRVFVSCDMTGSYATDNGGDSWRMFNLHGPVNYYVFDPLDSNVVYANSIGLFKSTNRGLTWQLFYPQPTEVLGVVSKGDHAEERLVMKDSTRRTVLTFAVDPAESNRLYAAISIDDSIGFFSSENNGAQWKKEFTLELKVQNIFVVPSSPSQDRTLMLTTTAGIWKRTKNQWTFHKAPSGVRSFTSFAGGYDKKQDKFIVYAISGKSYFNPQQDKSGIFYSEDGGSTWSNRQSGILSYQSTEATLPEWRAIATSSGDPSVLYVSYNHLKIHPDTTCIGVAKSADFGLTWDLVWQDKLTRSKDIPAANFKDAWINDRFGPTWGENPFSIGVDPTNASICFTSDFGRTVRTLDDGKTWTEVYSRKKDGYGWASRGLEVTTSYTLVFDPFDEDHLFIANTDVGLTESKDGGESWQSATKNNGIPDQWINSTYWIAFDPAIQGKIWAVMSGTHDLPRPKMWRNKETDQYKGGILTSENGGQTWTPVSKEIGEAAFTHIVIDPKSSPEKRTLYACAFGKGVYKSSDGGYTWKLKNNGIHTNDPLTWRITNRADGTLFLIVSRRSEDGSIGNAGDGRLYRSTDGAASWQEVRLPEGVNGPTSIMTDPTQPARLLLSAWGRPVREKFKPDIGGGIYLSEDDGKSWKPVLSHDQHIHDITYDTRTKVFYSCGFNGSAYRSENGGENWDRIKGFNFKWGKRVDLDVRNPEKVFIITFGGGVWHGPARGDKQALEDISPPLMRF